jgi:hypothetical protein
VTTDLEAALDRQCELVLATTDSRLFFHRLIALWKLLTTEPLLAGVVNDALNDAEKNKAQFDAGQAEIAAEALHLLQKHRRQFQRFWATKGPSLESTAETLRNPNKVLVPGKHSSVGVAVTRLRNTVASGIETLSNPSWQVHELRNQLDALQERSEHAERSLTSWEAAAGGFAAIRLRELVQAANPAPNDGPLSWIFAKFAEFRGVAQALHGHGPTVDLEHDIQTARIDLATLREDLRLRLVLGRSRLALVRRFAGRCERYEAAELRALCRAETKKQDKKVEHQLTMRFARYLYDHGLNPLVDPKIADLRPDVYEPIPGNPLYVEAKQYDSPVTAATLRRKMRDAVSQVLDTWGRLAQQQPVPEAFLLVFRRGGPRLELPELVRVETGRLYLVLADIAPPAQSGSKNRLRPVRMDTAMLIDGSSQVGS